MKRRRGGASRMEPSILPVEPVHGCFNRGTVGDDGREVRPLGKRCLRGATVQVIDDHPESLLPDVRSKSPYFRVAMAWLIGSQGCACRGR
jgi:hypothetical protein